MSKLEILNFENYPFCGQQARCFLYSSPVISHVVGILLHWDLVQIMAARLQFHTNKSNETDNNAGT